MTITGIVIEGCYFNEEETYLQYKNDYKKGIYLLGELRNKYNLNLREWRKLNKRLSSDLGISTRGGNNRKYNGLFDIESVYFCKSSFSDKTKKLRKCFFLKVDGKHINGVGGFVDFLSPKIINDLIHDELVENE